jgi:hypothetical protein
MQMMKRTMVALAMMLGGALHAQDKDISGNWQGTLQAGKGLRTVVKITKDDGKYKAVLYSIDQGGQPLPTTSITLQGSAVNMAIKGLDLTYTGTLNPDGDCGQCDAGRPDACAEP